MEVRRKAMGIVLSMTSSRNVEEVVLFLKKQLLKTQEADFEKVCHIYAFDISNLSPPVGVRIQTAAHPVYPCHGHQVLRSRRERCACSNGVSR